MEKTVSVSDLLYSIGVCELNCYEIVAADLKRYFSCKKKHFS